MILDSSKDLFNIMGQFYSDAFKQICDVDGLDLSQVQVLNTMLTNKQMALLKIQIERLMDVSEKLGRTLPATKQMIQLYSLLMKLKAEKRREEAATGQAAHSHTPRYHQKYNCAK